MNPMQKSYRSFIESVCKQFACTDAIRPLQEGFAALCEARYTYPTQKLHHYFNHTVRRPAEIDKQAGQIVSEANKHKGDGRRITPVDVRVLLVSNWIYNDFINGLRHGIELVNSGNADDEFCLDGADEEPLDDDILTDICSDCSSDDLPFTVGNILAWGITHERAGGSNEIERRISAAIAGGNKFRILMACAAHCPQVLMAPSCTGACHEFVERELSDEYLTDKTTFTYKGTVNNIWLLHGTSKESARNIAMHGFDRGNKLGSLAYNTSYNEEDDVRYNGDYMFAYALDSLSPSHDAPLGRFFGGGAIVFKSSAVAAYHGNDAISTPGEPEDLQYIFDKSVPDSCYLVVQTNDGSCVITGEGGRQLFKGSDARCLEWLKKNSDIYAHMMYKWKPRGNATKTDSMMAGNANLLCEAGDRTSGSAWDTVEWIHINHADDPRMDMDINLDSLWATGQKDSATREDVIGRFIEDAADFNKWLATSEDGGAFITSAVIKFKGDPDAITVDIPYTVNVVDLVTSNRNSLQESAGSSGSPEIPASFYPTTGAQMKVDVKLRQLGIVVDWSSYVPSRNRSWASQGMPSGTASAYTVSEAEKDGSYILANKRTICFYVSVSELARTPVDMYDVNDRMGSDYREIGVDTKFVPPEEPMSK